MCSKCLQGVVFNSQETRSNLLRSISNQIATLQFYNIYFIALSLMSFSVSLPLLQKKTKRKLHDFYINRNVFHFLYGFVSAQIRKHCTFKISCREAFSLISTKCILIIFITNSGKLKNRNQFLYSPFFLRGCTSTFIYTCKQSFMNPIRYVQYTSCIQSVSGIILQAHQKACNVE